jgi:protein-S-isoprenylcysteine O-methyltransferase Ste14
MTLPKPPPAPSSRPASIAAYLQVRWVRHALALVLAVIVPLLLRALADAPTRATGFLGFLALALGFGLVLVGALLYAWWAYTEWIHGMARDVESWAEPWRFGRGPTAFTRHPAWLAVIALVLGQALVGMTPALLVWAVLVVIGLNVLVVRHDEPQLAQAHAEAYDAYRTRVARWLPWRGVLQMLREIGQMLRNSVR